MFLFITNHICHFDIGLTVTNRCTSDVDECSVKNGGCAHTCTDKDGGYDCGCLDGFTLADNHLDCEGTIYI